MPEQSSGPLPGWREKQGATHPELRGNLPQDSMGRTLNANADQGEPEAGSCERPGGVKPKFQNI